MNNNFGNKLIKTARAIKTWEPLIVLVLMLGTLSINALAQTPTGSLFGSDQQIGNTLREAIKWGRNLLFLGGIIFAGWGIINYGTEKSWAKQAVASVGCFGFGGIVSLLYSLSQGNAVNLDTSGF